MLNFVELKIFFCDEQSTQRYHKNAQTCNLKNSYFDVSFFKCTLCQVKSLKNILDFC